MPIYNCSMQLDDYYKNESFILRYLMQKMYNCRINREPINYAHRYIITILHLKMSIRTDLKIFIGSNITYSFPPCL